MKAITLARKPLVGTVAANVLKHGCGGLNIAASRIETGDNLNGGAYAKNPTHREGQDVWTQNRKGDTNCFKRGGAGEYTQPEGRFPANLILSTIAVEALNEQSGESVSSGGTNARTVGRNGIYGAYDSERGESAGGFGDIGGASRYFKQIGESK